MVTMIKSRNRIKEVRESKGITQTELGRRVKVSEPTINRYERGNRKPTREMMHEIADALEVPLISLFVNPNTRNEDGSGNGKSTGI